jgi:hypothetical protein
LETSFFLAKKRHTMPLEWVFFYYQLYWKNYVEQIQIVYISGIQHEIHMYVEMENTSYLKYPWLHTVSIYEYVWVCMCMCLYGEKPQLHV